MFTRLFIHTILCFIYYLVPGGGLVTVISLLKLLLTLAKKLLQHLRGSVDHHSQEISIHHIEGTQNMAFRILTEPHRQFQKALLAAYINFRRVLTQFVRKPLEGPLSSVKSPRSSQFSSPGYISTESAVKCRGTISGHFPVQSDVKTFKPLNFF